MADLVDSLLTLARADEGRYDMIAGAGRARRRSCAKSSSLPSFWERTRISPCRCRSWSRRRYSAMRRASAAAVHEPRDECGQVHTVAAAASSISLSHRLDGVTFSVRDTGVGIAPSDLPHIFERFWRADRVRSRCVGARGLRTGAGDQPVDRTSAWRIDTATSRLGRGSVFTVQLPGRRGRGTIRRRPRLRRQRPRPQSGFKQFLIFQQFRRTSPAGNFSCTLAVDFARRA